MLSPMLYYYNRVSILLIMDTNIMCTNEILYKGMDTSVFDNSYQDLSWFSKNEKTAQKYGHYVHKLLTTRPLILVNIMSAQFHSLQEYQFHGYYSHTAPDEVCLFNPKHCNLLYAHNNLVIKQGGGTLYYGQFDSGKAIDDNAIDISVMRTLGYDGPIQYDDNGKVIILGYEWIQDYKRQKNLQQLENVVTVTSTRAHDSKAKKKTPKR